MGLQWRSRTYMTANGNETAGEGLGCDADGATGCDGDGASNAEDDARGVVGGRDAALLCEGGGVTRSVDGVLSSALELMAEYHQHTP
ncbi:hypothetical protein PIB30_101158 [Stylosanthes scabra]|uniref:Uncharacterized protein n=1 Tax=Stylosanthes scabra TaxID=79078 RepID=A0ABU6UW90_9FABA|nr:hypothetical protein [Stylosanthes scabra]